ncbi:conjugative transfer protein MobI(A/C) [Amphritea sp. 2_MG-2023]|uniref:conjugative transfer protein MobI(A/C) n=1 Tax=Amphritea TaxID=515417 RepID=UPI001C07D0C6|nr:MULTISPECIES: conjugative transfer protein MobI(A/C) [Amphritea]MBU2967013.1 hypothetical protein [Amphritea atlantica]MDO6420830.1 conjugative transfer protein MobI(A/C) [Amphritea sp. 2_MG-2023]
MALKDKENDVDLPSDVMSTLKDLEEHMDGYDFIRYGIKLISDQAYRLAREKCYFYHLFREDAHKKLSEKEWGFLICRARRNPNSNGISIDWLEQNPIAKDRRRKGGPTVLSKRIAKGKSQNYNRQIVITSKRRPYETELYDELEPQFVMLRHLSMLLTKAERAIRDLQQSHIKTLNKLEKGEE